MNSFLENIFSVKNNKCHKIITILGLKVSFKSHRAKMKYLLKQEQKKNKLYKKKIIAIKEKYRSSYLKAKELYKELSLFNYTKKFVMPEHFYSPIPNKNDSMDYIKNKEKNIPISINLNYDEQILLLQDFKKIYDENCFAEEQKDLNKTNGNLRFYHKNKMFKYSDAFGLSLFLRYFKPKNVIEIGCGFSSAVMLDTKDMYLKDENINFTYIEPYPERLLKLVSSEDNINLIQQRLQDIDYKIICDNLNEGDLLFIDSTHVLKYNSDVMYIFNKILPNLKKGVFVHFHDIFYPFEYPDVWVQQGRFWNETFYLKQFLSYNSIWKIQLWINAIYAKNSEFIKQNFPLFVKKVGGSIYLKKEK